ncbi:hypothetical protein ACFQBQ_11450 [Granulicella cerasi]|uniref:C1q domain-containing protein n=1 Tax=Granulicella cerasi TaxID=741063 RepID=A0ABW1Z9U1_9BACT|nr:hypothetical protein [Granulicella cerasi]
MKSGWKRWSALLAFALMWASLATAQVTTTAVSDTVYRADGTAAQGTVLISWNAFTMANGVSVPAGVKTVTLDAQGGLRVALAPNAGATPMGNYYTVVYHLTDGTVSKEYWVIPVTVPGGGAAKIAGVRNQVLPASVAMQTVSKQYVDTQIAQAQIGAIPLDSSPYVLKAGDTMSGPLVLPGDPVTATQAADKNYVDTNVTAVAAGINGKVALLPSATQVVSQPDNTELQVNRLNGELYASGFVASPSTDGVAAAQASPECVAGKCSVVIDANYSGTGVTAVASTSTHEHLKDERGAAEYHLYLDPHSPSSDDAIASTQRVQSTQPAATYGGNLYVAAESAEIDALSGGSNTALANGGSVPYFKSTYTAQSLTGNYYTLGQHLNTSSAANCYAVGDCIVESFSLNASGGARDASDEGSHMFDWLTYEDTHLFRATCASGCTPGSTSLTTTVVADGGTQGEGRYLIDTNPAKVISVGQLISGTVTTHGLADFSGSSFPVSVFLATAAAANPQATNVAPGTVTLPIATSGVASYFATNTAALPSTNGVACVADDVVQGLDEQFETAAFHVVDGTHVQLTLNKPHQSGATIAVGGLCGYGIESKVDTVGVLKQVFPVLGSTSATELLYAGGQTSVIGRMQTTGGYLNESFAVTSIVRSSNVATATVSGDARDLSGMAVTLSGASDPSFNGTFTMTSTASNKLQFTSTGADTTTSGGTVSVLTGSYALYPMAEVLSVMNAGTRAIDGAFTLAANTVNWAAGDTVEEPHYFQADVKPSYEVVTRYLPQRSGNSSRGLTYSGNVGPGTEGFNATNANAATEYRGEGGTHLLPSAGVGVNGPWKYAMDVEAGESAALHVGCNLHGCSKWNSTYALMLMDSASGATTDAITFAPQTRELEFNIAGGAASLGVNGFTTTTVNAQTMNVTTLNATSINGGVSASAITTGTIAAARLPVFGPSGATHAVGAVPDPGASAGATRYLREDGTWSVPIGGSASNVVFADMTYSTNYGAQATTNSSFFKILLPSVTTDTSGAWDATNNVYVVPVTGTYQVVTTLRFADSSTSGVNYGVGAAVAVADVPSFLWFTTPAATRNGAQNVRTVHLNAGDHLQMYGYVDGTAFSIQAAEMTIALLSAN